MNKGFFVGIDDYAARPLVSCVKDATRMALFCAERELIPAHAIRVLLNRRATRSEIRKRLSWLTEEAVAGDHLLFFFSGHGAQMATRDALGNISGYDEMLCPVDYVAGEDTALVDDDLSRWVATVPAGVRLTVIVDACCSGTILDLPSQAHTVKAYPLPADLGLFRSMAARSLAIAPAGFKLYSNQHSKLTFLAACGQNDDAYAAIPATEGLSALTFCLLQQLQEQAGLTLPMREILHGIQRQLSALSLQQQPVLAGDALVGDRGFW